MSEKIMKILYGNNDTYVDVTKNALINCLKSSVQNSQVNSENKGQSFNIVIPAGDGNRARFFGDPLVGTLKNVKIIIEGNDHTEEKIYPHDQEINIKLDINPNILFDGNQKYNLQNAKSLKDKATNTLSDIHNKLSINYGSFRQEYPEQLMTAMFLDSKAKVLELGANIGRNTLVIASILDNQENLVSLECNPEIYQQLIENKEINNYNFHAENSAISKRKLFAKGWETYLENRKPANSIEVNILTYQELCEKYDIDFDTLIADCEGALYYILEDEPDMLKNFNMIIMENDYWNIDHKKFVDTNLTTHGFERIYCQNGGFGPCRNCFYEVWKK